MMLADQRKPWKGFTSIADSLYNAHPLTVLIYKISDWYSRVAAAHVKIHHGYLAFIWFCVIFFFFFNRPPREIIELYQFQHLPDTRLLRRNQWDFEHCNCGLKITRSELLFESSYANCSDTNVLKLYFLAKISIICLIK